MKTIILASVVMLMVMHRQIAFSQYNFDTWEEGTNTSTAVLLSLQQLPLDIGNLYAGNWVRGIGYSVIQASLVAAVGITLATNGWGHHSYRYDSDIDNRRLTSAERERLAWYAVAYIAVKGMSGIDAGITANRNREKLNMSVSMHHIGPVLSLKVNF